MHVIHVRITVPWQSIAKKQILKKVKQRLVRMKQQMNFKNLLQILIHLKQKNIPDPSMPFIYTMYVSKDLIRSKIN